MTSSRPYLIRALYEWILDNNEEAFILVNATFPDVFVPREYVDDGKIIFNITPKAISDLSITNSEIEFYATFSGHSRHVFVPIPAVMAIYTKEGIGMVFGDEPGGDTPPDNSKFKSKPQTQGQTSKKSHLKVVK